MKRPAIAAILLVLVFLFTVPTTAQTSAVTASATAPTSADSWEPEMQLKVKAVGAPKVSPDGKRIVYTVSEAVTTPDKSEFVTQIWLGTIATKQNLQITF